VLDFVLAGIALVFLAVAASGGLIVASSVRDISNISSECQGGGCSHLATVVSAQRTYLPSTPIYPTVFGRRVDYCMLTMNLNGTSLQAVVDGAQCPVLPAGSQVSIEVWHGTVETVTAPDGVFLTYLNPEVTAGAAAFQLLALLPFAMLLAMIEIDLAHHHLVLRIRRWLRRRGKRANGLHGRARATGEDATRRERRMRP
jgi:hypothetical protein